MEVFSSEPFSLSREEHSLSNLSISLMGGWRYWYTWLLRKGVMVPGSYLEILAEFSQVSALTDVHTFGTFWLIFFFWKIHLQFSATVEEADEGGLERGREHLTSNNGGGNQEVQMVCTDVSPLSAGLTSLEPCLSKPCLTRTQCHSGGHLGSTQPRAIQSIISSTLVSSPAQGVMWFYI